MLALVQPRYGIHYLPGDAFFTWQPGGFLTQSIALESDRARYEAGLPVPTHCGVISGQDEIIEATWPKARRTAMRPLMEDGRRFVIVKRLAGQTQASVEAMLKLAGDLADQGVDYDAGALFGFTLSRPERRGEKPNFLEDPEEYFCSELLAFVLRETAALRTTPPPAALMKRHPSWWTPYDLYALEGLWEVC
ncbi:hypothetical protein AAU61_14510 [Desulfocarbo indianensis]|nr:hypothetical protein AAU61_14510 [Desulfocarbo indianensis]